MRAYLNSFFFAILAVMMQCTTQKEQQPDTEVWQDLYKQWANYREATITQRRFSPLVVEKLLLDLENDKRFALKKAGASAEGRPIYLLKLGQGPTSVLLWSQMHGDEPTATAALADMFNFFRQEGDGFDWLRESILQNTTLYVLPMLNPDGAERYQRRNALDIDLNRDALALASPESRLLKEVRDSLQAQWGFNLHDQNIRYSAGPEGPPASISLLAPPIDAAGTADATRKRAMQLVVEMNEVLQQFIPDAVGKWKDEFEPRAFGENMQRWGTSTVLIESGGHASDPEKQQVRRLNFIAMLAALHSIATESWQQQSIDAYYGIPENARYLFDLVVRGAQLSRGDSTYQADIAIDLNEKELRQPGQPLFYYQSSIEDFGDLSVFRGYEELDATGLSLLPGKTYPQPFDNLQALQQADISSLLRQGYTAVIVKELPAEFTYNNLPINIFTAASDIELGLEEPADFVLMQEDVVRYAIVNGFVYDLQKGENGVKNARVER